MNIKSGRRSQIAVLIESFTGTGLKFGVPAAVLAAAYLLFVVFGPKLGMMSTMKPADRAYLEHSVVVAEMILRTASFVMIFSLCLRFLYETGVGQLLTIAGGVLYFFSPAIFWSLTLGRFANVPLYQGIVSEFTLVGIMSLIPGVCLLLRDMVLRVRNGVRMKLASARLWGNEDIRVKRQLKRKIYEQCWDMPFCQEFVRNVCPAWNKRTPCWRVKCGCYCDEETIMKAMTVGAIDNPHARGIMQSLATEKAQRSTHTARQKRMRCRRCIIYAEHQRQKYRILSPLVFPVVALLFWLFYDLLASRTYVVLEQMDRFMRFLVYKQVDSSFAAEGHLMTTLTMVWLGIVVLSYALRGLEYLIFDLQV